MVRATKKKQRTARRVYGLVFLIFLSAAAGVGLYRLSPSLLDIGRIFRHAADKIVEQSADSLSAEPVLRGTVFDRNLKELAVSYRLYSLYVRPAEITNAREVVRILADITGQDEGTLHARLNEAKSIINVAKHLEQAQVDMIKNARLSGLYVKPVEERFYPEHETAASLVGFTGVGVGLAGVEGVFDMLLQEGEFPADMVPGIDFRGEGVLGRGKVDVVLTVDLTMQKQVEQQLKEFLDESCAARGVALLMDPRDGAVLAWASQPSFNPNYYWRKTDAERQSLFEEYLDPDLLRNLQVRIAAIRKKGESGNFLLPETIAKKDYGLTAEEIEEFGRLTPLAGKANCSLPSCGPDPAKDDTAVKPLDTEGGNPVELAAAVAGLVNGGWLVSPYVLAGVYDRGSGRVYERSVDYEHRDRVLSPSMGIRVRRDLASSFSGDQGRLILQAESTERMRMRDGKSEYIMQEILLGAVPAKSPEMMLFMVTQKDDLYPFPRKQSSGRASVREFGEKLLASAYSTGQTRRAVTPMVAARFPQVQDRNNYNQFLISSRIDFQESRSRGAGRVAVMPQLVGLSLRKGLQRLNDYSLQVKVQGSGQIISQVPGPGEPLQGIGECVLTLASEI